MITKSQEQATVKFTLKYSNKQILLTMFDKKAQYVEFHL